MQQRPQTYQPIISYLNRQNVGGSQGQQNDMARGGNLYPYQSVQYKQPQNQVQLPQQQQGGNQFSEKFDESQQSANDLQNLEVQANIQQPQQFNNIQQTRNTNYNQNVRNESSDLNDGQAIQLIRYNQQIDQFELNTEAENYLQQYTENVGFVSIAGKYRTGKSFLLNKLLNLKGKGFKIDSSTNSCTQGIWMWSKPIYNQNRNMNIFFVDTEGTESVEGNVNKDAKIFALTILLSSFFIYNSVGCINESSIQQLQLTTTISKNIAVSQYNSKNDVQLLSNYFPKFLWILRDFTLELADYQGKKITENQYLEQSLLDQSSALKQTDQSKRIRQALLDFFKDRDCMVMIRPVIDEKQLQNIEKLPENQIRKEFLDQVSALRNKIIQCTPIKQLNGEYLSIRMILTMMKSFISKINEKNGVPNISSAWDSIIESECQAAYTEAYNNYIQKLGAQLQDDTVKPYTQFYKILKSSRQYAFDCFDQVAGQHSQSNDIYKTLRKKLYDDIKNYEKQVISLNSDMGKEFFTQQLNSSTLDLKLKLNKNFYTTQNIDQYIADYNLAISRYRQLLSGPQKGEVLVDLLATIQQYALQSLISSAKINLEEQKFYEQLQAQTGKLDEISKQKDTYEQRKNNLANKVQQLEKEKNEIEKQAQELYDKQQNLDNGVVENQEEVEEELNEIVQDNKQFDLILKSLREQLAMLQKKHPLPKKKR